MANPPDGAPALPESPARGGAGRAWFAVAALLAVHVVLAWWAAAQESVTADEILHVTNGYFIDRYGDYRVQPENGILPQRLHGLAALWTGAPTPTLDPNEYWRTSSGLVLSHQFFYETGHDHFPMLLLARALNLVFSIGVGCLVFAWARHLGGTRAGLAAVALFTFDPNFLAHGALATSDMAAVFFLAASASVFWWQLARPSVVRIAASSLTFGLACVAKYSGVLLIPVFVGLLAWHFHRQPGRSRWLRPSLVYVGTHAAGAVAVIWLCYGFRYSGFAPGLPAAAHYAAPWDRVLPYIGWQGKVVEFCLQWKLLPEAFLYGYAWVIQSAAARAAFLAGQYGIYGWPSFFPLAFAWKTTESVLAGVALALGVLARRWSRNAGVVAGDARRVAPLVLLFAAYWALSLTSKLNIGHRHILPTYPMLFIAIGVAATTLPRLWGRVVPLALAAAQLLAVFGVAPHFLAYFNQLAGGPAHGYRLLVDSSLDWGQDLPGLKKWLEQHHVNEPGTAYLAYFGSGEPTYYDIRATRLPFINGFKFPHQWYEPRPGVYCISATILQQVYSGIDVAWSPALETEYQTLRQLEPAFRDYFTRPAARPDLERLAPAEKWETGWRRFDKLRFARICATLRRREPDAMIGYSILVYDVSAAELAAALGPVAPPLIK